MCALGIVLSMGAVKGFAINDQGPLKISPLSVDVGEMPAGSIKNLEFIITNSSGKAVRLRYIYAECDCSITLPDSGMVSASGTFILRARLAAGHLENQRLEEMITILTDNDFQKELKIPVCAWVTETQIED